MTYYYLYESHYRIGKKFLRIKDEIILDKDEFFDLFECKKIEYWDKNNHVIYEEDGIRHDFIKNIKSIYVSRKFKNCITKFSPSKDVEFFQIPFFDENKNNEIRTYYAMNVLNRTNNNNKADIFFYEPYGIVVSERIKKELQKNKLGRFYFQEFKK